MALKTFAVIHRLSLSEPLLQLPPALQPWGSFVGAIHLEDIVYLSFHPPGRGLKAEK